MDPVQQIEQQYAEPIRKAEAAAADAQNRLNNALAQLDATSPNAGLTGTDTNPAYDEIGRRVSLLTKELGDARQAVIVLQQQKAKAAGDAARAADLMPEQKGKLEADAKLAQAQADNLGRQQAVDQANIDFTNARTDAEKAGAQSRKTEAQAALNNSQAALNNAQNGAISAGAAMLTAQTGASRAPSEIALNTAQAGQAGAQTNLVAAQAAKLEQETKQLQQQLANTTDADVRRDIQASIATKEAQTAALRGQATTADANVQRAQQGPYYGFQEKVAYIDDLIRKGVIKDADAAHAALLESLNANVAGTTPYEAFTGDRAALAKSQENAVSQRNADTSLVGNRTSAFGGLAGASFGSLLDANKYAAIGSGAGADAYGTVLGNVMQLYGGPSAFQTPARVNTDVPMWAQRAINNPPAQTAPAGPAAGGGGYNPNDIQWRQPAQPGGFQTQAPQTAAPVPVPGAGGGPYQGAPNPNAFGSGGGDVQVPAAFNNLGPVTAEDLARARQQSLAIVNGTHRMV